MLNEKETFAALQALKECRFEMVQDFLNHKPEIYAPSFKYENSPALLSLAREKYFMTWLSRHWHFFCHQAAFFSDQQKEKEAIFATVFLKLLSKWSIIKSDNAEQLNLSIQLVQDMQNSLNEFIKVGENSDCMRNKLEVEIEKNSVLFDREIKKLNEIEL
jgi:hypothetical protein